MQMGTELVIRFDYGRTIPWVTHLPDGTWSAVAGPDMLLLHSTVRLRGENLKSIAVFEVGEGETA
jgi:hypothetical protein